MKQVFLWVGSLGREVPGLPKLLRLKHVGELFVREAGSAFQPQDLCPYCSMPRMFFSVRSLLLLHSKLKSLLSIGFSMT